MIAVERFADLEQCCRRAADLVLERRRRSDHFVLGVATGATMVRLYEMLVADRLETQGLHLVLLDEYVGLADGDRRRFRLEIEHALAGPLGIPAERVLAPPCPAAGLPSASELADFEQMLLDWGGVDLQLLGIGSNGHLAFNEPGSHPASRTRVVRLHRSTRLDNAASFATPAAVPECAVTQGVGTILDAASVLLLAAGRKKRGAVGAMLHSPETCWLPASLLRDHPDARALVDREALPSA